MSNEPEIHGCDFCGDWPVVIVGRCHPTAPLRAELAEDGTLSLFCYLPECSRLVWRVKVESMPADSIDTGSEP